MECEREAEPGRTPGGGREQACFEQEEPDQQERRASPAVPQELEAGGKERGPTGEHTAHEERPRDANKEKSQILGGKTKTDTGGPAREENLGRKSRALSAARTCGPEFLSGELVMGSEVRPQLPTKTGS
jgi:hypothetical protein